ncbi:MAG: AI-2E family transporter [Bacteroidales bacterium]|nr:AI-2E family transporter [Bacteroidales bacterium]MBN2758275.1 AI-2E family transporter [Bacteroidales bacterium]
MKNFNLQEIFFFFILIAVTIGFYNVIEPFIVDIFLALILAVLFRKPLNFLIKKFKGKKARAAAITLLLVVFVIVIPLTVIGIMLSSEVGNTYSTLKNYLPEIESYINNIPEKLSKIPQLQDHLEQINWTKIAEAADKLVSTLGAFILGLIQKTFINVGFMIMHFFIVLFLLYYLFIDGQKLLKRIQYLVPLKDKDEQELFDKLEKVTDAIIVNTFMIGVLEGTYGGILFAILGIPSPFFWGTIMAFLSIIPLVGANSILLPMAIVQLFIGNYWTGIIILVIGVGAVTVNQNIVRPRLDGHKSGMHPAIMFLASMGGLIWMGIIGFLAGPIITGLFLIIWNQFGVRYQNKLEQLNKGD